MTMSRLAAGQWKLPQFTDIKENNLWVAIPKVSRTIPFGYELDPNDAGVLLPIADELDKLEMAKKYLKQYSYREVANWLTRNTGRTISHVGLMKRLQNERRRKNTLTCIPTHLQFENNTFTCILGHFHCLKNLWDFSSFVFVL